jgi:hypothetical protein
MRMRIDEIAFSLTSRTRSYLVTYTDTGRGWNVRVIGTGLNPGFNPHEFWLSASCVPDASTARYHADIVEELVRIDRELAPKWPLSPIWKAGSVTLDEGT